MRGACWQAVETEAAAYIDLVVRNGQANERTLVSGVGTLKVRAPRVNDRRVDEEGNKFRFTSEILPPYPRELGCIGQTVVAYSRRSGARIAPCGRTASTRTSVWTMNGSVYWLLSVPWPTAASNCWRCMTCPGRSCSNGAAWRFPEGVSDDARTTLLGANVLDWSMQGPRARYTTFIWPEPNSGGGGDGSLRRPLRGEVSKPWRGLIDVLLPGRVKGASSNDPIESTFATVRLRQRRTKGCGPRSPLSPSSGGFYGADGLWRG